MSARASHWDTLIVVTTLLLAGSAVWWFYASSRIVSSGIHPSVVAKHTCINNLRHIDGAKEQWALEKGITPGTDPDASAVFAFIREGEPQCPGGGTYTLNVIGVNPTCSIGGKHALPKLAESPSNGATNP